MKNFLTINFFFFWAFLSFAEIKVPALTSPVVDEVGLFSSAEKASIEANLQNLYAAKGPQLQILVVKSLEGNAIEDYSIKVAEAWKLGSKKEGDGLLLLIAIEDRKMRIEVGQGIEGTITDFDSHKFIDKILKPAFREKDYYGGVMGVISAVQEKFGIEVTAVQKSKRLVRKNKTSPFNFLLMIIIFIIFIMTRMGPLGAVGLLAGRRHYGGGFGGSGGGGGGWGGGGGGFSGGGSSGSW